MSARVAILGAIPASNYAKELGIKLDRIGRTTAWNCNLLDGLSRIEDPKIDCITYSKDIVRPGTFRKKSVTFHFVPLLRTLNATTFFAWMYFNARRLLEKIDPDVVHGIGTEHPYAAIAALSGRRWMITVHGVVNNYLRYSPFEYGLYWRLIAVVEKRILRRAINIISINPFAKTLVQEISGGYKRYFDIPNAVDRKAFDLSHDYGGFDVGFIGTSEKRKGLAEALHAFKKIRAIHRNARLHIVAGSQSEEFKKLIERLDIGDSIRWNMSMGNAGILSLLSKLQVLVVPSHRENAPMVISEAMACGTPVVGYSACGIRFMVRDGETGFLVKEGNVEELAGRVSQILGDSRLARELGANARAVAYQDHHPDAIAEKTAEAYRNIGKMDRAGIREPRRVLMMGAYPIYYNRQEMDRPDLKVNRITTWNFNLINGLDKLRKFEEIHVATISKDVRTFTSFCKGSVVYHVFPRRRLFSLATFFLFDRFRIRKLIKRIDPDLIHGIGTEHIYPTCALKSGRPAVITIHGIINEILRVSPVEKMSMLYILRHYERKVLQAAKSVICINPYVREYLGAKNGHRLFDVENPVNDLFYANQWMDDAQGILFIGSRSHLKGYDIFMDVISKVKDQCPDVPVYFIEQKYSHLGWMRLWWWMRKYPCPSYVKVFRQMDQEGIMKMMKQCTLLVSTSRQETAPMVIAEAMAMGMPVVAHDVGGVRHLVDEGNTGYLVQCGDSPLMAARVVELLRNRQLRRNMGRNARSAAIRRFKTDVIAAQTANVYDNVFRQEHPVIH
jgi:glycosyltransferase involved in cell wall biosynthesis